MDDGTRTIVIAADGRIQFVWDDDLGELTEQGRAVVRRAANVEFWNGTGWMIDMAPSGGGLYGPYRQRSVALMHGRAVVTGRLLTGRLLAGDPPERPGT
jgi:hypothetical protein